MKAFLFFMIISIMSVVGVHANEYDDECIGHQLEKLFEGKDSSIREYRDGKFYLNLERLIFSEQGMFLRTDFGELYPIYQLGFDANGYYQEPPARKVKCKNSNCPMWYPWYFANCPRCGTPN